MKVGDIVRIKRITDSGIHHSIRQHYLNKLAIVVIVGTWSVDVRIIENGMNPRIAKEDCEVISESR
jgi:hypothetical protein